MASYTLHLEIDRAKVAQFNTQGWKLCFASGVEVGGNVDYSVVAFSRGKLHSLFNQDIIC